MRKLSSLFLLIISLSLHSIAHATETNRRDEKPRDLSLFTWRASTSILTGSVEQISFTRVEISSGLAFDINRLFSVSADLHMGSTQFAYKGVINDTLSIDSALWAYADFSADVGTNLHLLKTETMELDAFGNIETSILHSALSLRDIHITTKQGTFNVRPYANTNATLPFFWYRLTGGAMLSLRWGAFTPHLAFAIIHLDGILDIKLTKEAHETLSQLNTDATDVERSHSRSVTWISCMPGFDLHISDDSVVGITLTLTPLPESFIYGTNLSFALSL